MTKRIYLPGRPAKISASSMWSWRRALRIPLAMFIATLCVHIASAQTALLNGTNADGTILANTTNSYTLNANSGDSINLRLGTTNFYGRLQLYGPNGALLSTATDSTDDLIAYTATNSGTFTVLVSSSDYGGELAGTYALHLAQIPEAFIVPAGDEGGPMINGGNYPGTITLGDLDMWTFAANTGDSINLRLGTTSFYGKLQLYGPNGALLSTATDNTDDLIAYTATNSGTFTALVSSSDYGSLFTGTYVLSLAQMPEPFIVPPGDQGGGLNGSASYLGTINLGDQDIWAFTACKGEVINLALNTTNFYGKLQLYGSNGALLKTAQNGMALNIAYVATNCGTFTVLVSSSDYGSLYTGTYGLTAAGLSYELRLCRPVITGAQLTLNGVGGDSGATFILYSTTNVAKSFGLWTPVLTNQFDQYGVLTYTNVYNPALRQQYFRFIEMK